jgi:ketosteroid isomerase-like protein
VEVLPLDPKARAGRYLLRSVEVRKATRSELDRAQREDELARAEQDWDEAVVQRDVEALKRVAAPDYANFSGLGTAGTRDAFVQGTDESRKAGPNPWDHNERTMVTMRFFGDTAVVTGRVRGGTKEGAKANGFGRYLHIWQRRAGHWQLIGDHYAAVEAAQRPHTAIQVSREVLEGLAGHYRLGADTVLDLKPSGDHLEFKFDGRDYRLLPETENVFFDPANGATWIFVRDTKGRIVEVILNGGNHVPRVE